MVATYNWGITLNNEIGCGDYEVVDATNGVGGLRFSYIYLTQNGNLYFT